MPREGVFARVLEGGPLRAGDEVVVTVVGSGARGPGATSQEGEA
jgi:MOSC domain-containing protein YiiM